MTDQRRGKNLALAGMLLQAAFSVVALVLWRWTGSDAAMATTCFLAAGVPLWLMAAILFYCRQLASREATEIEELAAHGEAKGTIFERADVLEQRPAARRLARAEKWLAPAFTLLWTGTQAAAGILVGRRMLGSSVPGLANAGQAAVFMLAIAMAAFLFSYYCLGMAREERWRLLRATGSYMLVNSLAAAAGALALLLAQWKQFLRPDDIMGLAVPVIQLLLSLELLLNFVLDLYRPRVPGQEHRFSFDSRLFNVLAEPGKVGHSIAETINYQFGFEVSKTWFYQLVSKATVWLLIAGAAILLGMSCFVVVRDGESYVVRRLGSFTPGQAPLGPGLHFKWPWPVETVERFEPGVVQQLLLGAGRKRTEAEIRAMDYVGDLEVFDWSKPHGEHEELDFLIAFPPRKKEDPPVHIIKLVVLVQYRVKDVYKYGYTFVDPRRMLECLAYRELTQYFATATLDSPVEGGAKDRPQAIMTYGRAAAAEELKKRVQKMADANDSFGPGAVEITFVGFVGVHPPPEAAGEFEAVLKAQRAVEQKRFEAEADAARILAREVGSPGAAHQLALAITKESALRDLSAARNDPNQFQVKRQEYLRDANGRIGVLRKEVQQERLEGRHVAGRLTDREELLQAYESYLQSLQAIQIPADITNEAVEKSATEAEKLLLQASGNSAALVADAQAYRWGREMKGRGDREARQLRLSAFRANPTVYKWDHWLSVWEEALPNLYKYVVAVDPKTLEVRLDWHRQQSAIELPFSDSRKPEEKK